MSNPWLKFYTSDWRSDPCLRMCGIAARGLWIEMICLMHEATPYGHLLVNGQRPTDAQLAVLVGTAPDQIAALLGELESAGVFSRTREGVIYSRRLSRMAKKAATARNNGRKGGNPTLCNSIEKQSLDKGLVKGWVKTQKPEARIQKEEVGKPTSWRFEDFWSAWPNKVSKSAAEAAWRKLSEPDREAAFMAIRDWFSAWREQNPHASPMHAATYLNKGRWRDEFQSSIPNGNGKFSPRPENRPDPALEQIARLAGLGQASGHGGR